MTAIQDFYESTKASQLAQAYREKKQSQQNNDWLFLICLFLTLYI